VGGCLGGRGGLGLCRFANLVYGFKYGLGLVGFVGDKYLASIENMMRAAKRRYRASLILALSGLALTIVALLPMWGIIMSNMIMILAAAVLLTSLLLWLLINLGITSINYRITEISISIVLGMIKDKDLDPNHLTRLVIEFSNFATRFRMRSFLVYLIMFWGFFNVIFRVTVLLFGSVSLRLFATALAFVVPVSVSIIIALGSHYGELVGEVYVNPKDTQQLLDLIKSASFTWNSLFAMFIIPMVLILLSLPLILPVTITRSTSILTIACFSSYFALASSELINAMQWLMSVLVGRNITQLLHMANRLKAQGEGNKQ
jgi:hypothetical protein